MIRDQRIVQKSIHIACILTFTDPNERPARGREESSSKFMTEAIVEVRAKPLRHYIQNNRLATKFVDTLKGISSVHIRDEWNERGQSLMMYWRVIPSYDLSSYVPTDL